MIHPSTQLDFVSPEVGLGVFATEFIPEGTIVYVIDDLDIQIKPDDELLRNKLYKSIIEKYSYVDENGTHIISWDYAKYVNHCCNFNTISTGYGFEIAIRDIMPGEQITDEYGALNINKPIKLKCTYRNCRKVVKPGDINHYYKEWDALIQKSLKKVKKVKQPLVKYLDVHTYEALSDFLKTGENYKSVKTLEYSRRVLQNVK